MEYQYPSSIDIFSSLAFYAFPGAIITLITIKGALQVFTKIRFKSWFFVVVIATLGGTLYFSYSSGNFKDFLYMGPIAFAWSLALFTLASFPARLILLTFKKSKQLGVLIIFGFALIYLFFFPKKHFWFATNENKLSIGSRYGPAIHCQCFGIENSLQQRPSTCFGMPYSCVVIEKTDRCPLWPKNEPCPMYGLLQ